MKYLVTGAAGYIGCLVSKRLLEDGHAVVGIDKITDHYNIQVKIDRLDLLEGYEYFSFIKLALEDREAMSKLFSTEKFDCVIHLGAQAGVRYSIEAPFEYVDSNLVGMMTVLNGCINNDVQHLIYASSSSVYGLNSKMPFSTKDGVDHPVSLYAATKKSNELMAHSYSHLYDIPTTGLRFFTVYRPWGRPDMAYFKFAKAITEGKPIEIYNHGKMKRDFIYIDDIVEGVVLVLDIVPTRDNDRIIKDPSASTTPYRVFNIGSNQPVELDNFISEIECSLEKQTVKEYLPMQDGDVESTYADVSELESITSFKPEISLNYGVGEFVDWFKEYYKYMKFSFLVVFLWLFVSHVYAEELSSVRVKDINPKPNYGLTSDGNDYRDLVDKVLMKEPLWTRNGGVGWVWKTPIVIAVEKNSNSNFEYGVFKFHVGKGVPAGVDVPIQIDVFEKGKKGYFMIGSSYYGKNNKYKDKESIWLRVNAKWESNIAFVVIHANGPFVMMDEIDWVENKSGEKVEDVSVGFDFINYSINKLKENHRKRRIKIENQMDLGVAGEKEPFTIKILSAYSVLGDNNLEKKINTIDLYVGEKENLVIRIDNNLNDRIDVGYGVKVNGCNELSVNVKELEAVEVAGGSQEYDAIVPLEKKQLSIESFAQKYLWVEFRSDELSSNKECDVELYAFNDEGLNVSESVSVAVHNIFYEQRVQVNSWLFGKNIEQFGFKEVANFNPINTVVIHPASLINGRFEREIGYSKDSGMVLVLLEWPVWKERHIKKYKTLEGLLNYIEVIMAKNGKSYNEWAVYINDETISKKLDYFIDLAWKIDGINSNIRIYANPILRKNGLYLTLDDLEMMDGLVDIWQPKIDLAEKFNSQFFSKLESEKFWVYEVPPAPAKSVDPLDYRMMSWRMYALKANGVGFWGVYDISGKSAWDDYDGSRPDWAVVYEMGEKIVSSRRWEAFKDGIEDINIIMTLDRVRNDSVDLHCIVSKCDIGRWDKIKYIESIRNIDDILFKM